MKKVTKGLLAVLGAASLFGLASCGETPEVTPTPTPTPTEVTPTPTPEKQAVAEFKGSVTISEVKYDVVLALYEDKTLALKPGQGQAEKTGTYEFVEGEGYKLVIAGQELTTTWNAEAKSHEVVYELKLGEAGKGNVTLALKDENFVSTVKAPRDEFIANAKFDGVLNFYGAHVIHLVFNADGTYNITTDTTMAMVKGLLEKTGNYTYANNVFTVTIDGTEYKSVYNPSTNSYSLTYVIKGSDGNPEVTLTYQAPFVLTGSLADFGGLQFAFNVNSDGTCFADITTTMPSMDAIFDRSGTWKINEEGNYVFTVAGAVAGEETTDFVASVNAKGVISMTYKVQGDRLLEVELTGSPVVLSGEVSNMGGIVFDLKFVSATDCFIDITSKAAASMNDMFDHAATYEMVNGQIVVTAKNKTYTSTYDEATGTYKLVYEFQGSDGVFNPELTFSVWE